MRRREFLHGAGAVAALSRVPRIFAQTHAAPQLKPGEVSLRLDLTKPAPAVPLDFTGLSYESAQLAHPKFFSSENHQLIELLRKLSPEGILRIGGNTSELTHWAGEQGAATAAGLAEPPSAGHNTATSYTITAEAIRNLRGFLDATGWRLIYGLNLGRGTSEAAAAEAGYVAKTMGHKLVALQFGNEPDLFHHDDEKHTRWTYDEYATRWLQFEPVVRAAAPGVMLAGPDVASNWGWIQKFAVQMRGKISMLTGHYYIGGPPSNPAMNIDALLTPPQHLLDEVALVEHLLASSGLPYRMAEGNSCYNGGKPGMSDVFASALWAGDYMLQLAQAGYAGVNLHGGGMGVYTPIATDASGASTARPDYFGMLMAQQFAGATIVPSELKSNGANVTAYAATRGKELLLAIFNKSPQTVEVQLEYAAMEKSKHREGRVYSLTAPAVDAKEGVSFAMTANLPGNPLEVMGRGRSLAVPANSGMLVAFA